MGTVAGGLAIAGVAASALGTGVSVFGAMQQGQAQKAAADHQSKVAANNATIAAQNADVVQQQSLAKAVQEQKVGSERLSAQRAILGANGVTLDSGSSLDVQGSTAENTAINTNQDLYQGQLAAYGYETQGSNFNAQEGLDTLTGANAGTAGTINAGASFLSGASQVASKWAAFKGPDPFSGPGVSYS